MSERPSCGYGYVVSDTTYPIDHAAECGSDKYAVHVVSKVVSDNTICLPVCKSVLEAKANLTVLLSTSPNEYDDVEH